MIHSSGTGKTGLSSARSPSLSSSLSPSLLAVSIGLLASFSCSPNQGEARTQAEKVAETTGDRVSPAMLLLAFERALLSGEKSLAPGGKIASQVPITFHLHSLLSAHVGNATFEVREHCGTSYLCIDVKSCHRLFPDKVVGIEVNEVTAFEVHGEPFYGIRFKDASKDSPQGSSLFLPVSGMRSLRVDIHAAVNLSDMSGQLHKIEVLFTDLLDRENSFKITGDPTQKTMSAHFDCLAPGSSNGEGSMLVHVSPL